MGRIRRHRGPGVLSVVMTLLIASAAIRLGVQAEPALAEDAAPTVVTAIDDVDTDALLTAFREREARLTEREKQLRDRLQALRVAEAEIAEKLAALLAAEELLAATIAAADSAATTDLDQLTTVYENMKPKEAAALFEEMPPEFAAGFLGMMRPDAAALIMTELEPATAYSFSVVLAGRNANVPTQ